MSIFFFKKMCEIIWVFFFVRFVAFYWIFFGVRGTFLKLNMGNFVFLLWVGFKAPARRAPKRYSSAARRHIVHLATRKNHTSQKNTGGAVLRWTKRCAFFIFFPKHCNNKIQDVSTTVKYYGHFSNQRSEAARRPETTTNSPVTGPAESQ